MAKRMIRRVDCTRGAINRLLHSSFLVVSALYCAISTSAPPPSSMTQAQTKIQQINDKIELLRRTLTSAHDRRGALNKELSSTEKQIGGGVQQLRSLQKSRQDKEQSIALLQKKIKDLNQQLHLQQQLLATHVRVRYQMGEYQPLKWILNQDNPYKINHFLTYYQYIINARKTLIDQITHTRKTIMHHKQQLDDEVIKNQLVHEQLLSKQRTLQHHKQYHSALILSLDNEIQSQEQVLHEVEKNKKNLSHLLVSLAQKNSILHNTPFIKMRKKLPLPVGTSQRKMQKMNQGVTFFADEGMVVTAVYPGTVVFSDWLKGYGLLLIIDHGQGFMTLYAHNQSLFKHKGQTVQQGEQIASVGHSGGIKQNGLYFEIRLHGKAISPFDWLA